MEVDGAVFLGRMTPALLVAGPVVALAPTRWQIDGMAMETIGPDIAYLVGANFIGKIPCSDDT